MRMSENGVCSVCGGPVRSTNKTGICQLNPACKKANKAKRQREVPYVRRRCPHCGKKIRAHEVCLASAACIDAAVALAGGGRG